MNIVPGKYIGDFRIGDSLMLHKSFKDFIKTSDDKFVLDHITVRTNSQGLIDLVSTTVRNYNGISPGNTFRQIIENGHALFYDGFDQIFYLKSPQGLCVEKKYENLEFSKLLDSKIECLTNYDINAGKEVWRVISKDFEEIDRNTLDGLKSK